MRSDAASNSRPCTRRGHKDDPLYKVRRTLLTGDEHLTDRQRERLDKYLPVGDPSGEV
jgi:transposase